MSWDAVEAALDGILARRWYTNHGPLARWLESAVAESLLVRHAVAVVNPTIALVMLVEALGLAGEVLLPALAPLRCVQALRWAGVRPVFCDVDAETGRTTADGAAVRIGPAAAGLLLAVGADGAALAGLARVRGLAVLGDDAAGPDRAWPCVLRLPGLGDDAGTACILTDDDALAARLRNIRSSYGAGAVVPVVRTANGRLSEAQAAMSLLAWPPPCRTAAVAALRAALPEHQVLELGSRCAVVVADAVSRDRVLAELAGGSEALRPCSPPGACPVADRLARRAVLLPAGMEGDRVAAALERAA